MIYSERLKYIRDEKEIKQNYIADKLGISFKAYSMYETEYKIIPSKYINPLCNMLEISIDYLFGFNDIRNYPNSKEEIKNEIIKQRFYEFQKEYKLTQSKLAKILNTTQSVVSDFENGKRLIPTLYLYDICKKYHISADYLLGKIDTPVSFK